MTAPRFVGFTCAYTPLPLVAAAGFTPLRILPDGEAPDGAGRLLHDNLCPHVKGVLNRALDGSVPELAGVVVVASCDTMRRLADAWPLARPGDRIALLELPSRADSGAIDYFAGELRRLWGTLGAWAGRELHQGEIRAAAHRYDALARQLGGAQDRAAQGTLPGGRAALQALFNASVSLPMEEALAAVERALAAPAPATVPGGAIPLLLTGNVLVDPGAFELLEACGARIVADDVCTGGRQLAALDLPESGDLWTALAAALLTRLPCARTLPLPGADDLATRVTAQARRCGARGVVLHVLKFCDPYLARIPALRARLREAGLPLLVLEGDGSTRAVGQQRTRIEAFVEMLREEV